VLYGSFTLFYNLQRKDELFDKLFESFCEKNYFGKFPTDKVKKAIKEDFRYRFDKMADFVIKKNFDGIMSYIFDWHNQFERALFSKFTGVTLKNMKVELIEEKVDKYLKGLNYKL